jgi:hypothetical protein
MAKLRISKVEESERGDIGWAYKVEIDGVIRKDVIALDLHYDTKSFITADVTLLIDDLDVSAELNAIEALNTAKRMRVLFNLEKSQ